MAFSLTNGLLIDGTGEVLEHASVHVQGTQISSVGRADQLATERSSKVIDLGGMVILPGLIDLHTHLWGDVSEFPRGKPHDRFGEIVNMIEEHDSYLAMFMAKNATAALQAGFTTIRDLGSPRDVSIQVARALRDRLFCGPRMLCCASIDITYPEGKHQSHGVVGGNVTGRIEAIRAVRKKAGSGADWIHLVATGAAAGFWSANQELLTLEEMQAAVEEAHRLGRRVNANASGTAGIKNAILAGVDCIEHGTAMAEDDDLIPMMLEHEVGWVPTLCVYDAQKKAYEEAKKSGGKSDLPDVWIQRVIEEYEQLVIGYQKAREAGVLIGVGTDVGAPHVPHGKSAIEMTLFVQYGASEMDAILSATSKAAQILGLSDQIGSIHPGKEADILVLKKNPLEDIHALLDEENIVLVIRGGEIIVDRLAHQFSSKG